jgi:hypothetical protein
MSRTPTGSYTKVQTRNLALAEKLAAKNGGLLPAPHDLDKAGLDSLNGYIRKYPSLFAHLKRAPTRLSQKKREKYVALAERLAERNGGCFPGITRTQQKYKALLNYMRKHPDEFVHIKRKSKRVSPHGADFRTQYHETVKRLIADGTPLCSHLKIMHRLKRPPTVTFQRKTTALVLMAEKIAAEHEGYLYETPDFQKRFSTLRGFMRKYPEAFEHIPRRRRRTKEEAFQYHSARLEAYIYKNGGSFPASKDLPKGLADFLRQNGRRLWPSFPVRRRRTLDELVLAAEKSAEDNGGSLPTLSSLRGTDSGLVGAVCRHPSAFQHIPQRVGGDGKLRTAPEAQKPTH